MNYDISLSKKVLGHRKKNFPNVYDYNAYDVSAFGYYLMIMQEVHESLVDDGLYLLSFWDFGFLNGLYSSFMSCTFLLGLCGWGL